MKLLLLVLLLINIGLYGFFNQHFLTKAPIVVAAPEISPEKITLLNADELAALPQRTALVSQPLLLEPVVETCYEWGIFTGVNASRVEAAINDLSLQYTIKQVPTREAKRFWVYRQPLASAAEAQQKAAEFKALGIEDVFVVQEPKWRHAISFGVFSDEKLASKLLTDLQAKGVKNVVKALRNQGNNPIIFRFNAVPDTALASLKVLQPQYADSTIKEVSCQS